MKTITEFAAITLKNASKTQQELTAAGKTPEELPQALGEALKVEGDKLNWLLSAIEVVGQKQEDLKRVVVFQLAEGEKAPREAQQKGEHYFVAEYYPSLNKPKGGQERGRGDDKGRGGKRGGRRGDKRGEKREGGAGGPGGERGPRGPRGPRAPRGEQAAKGPTPNKT